jgi:hypothetical protein
MLDEDATAWATLNQRYFRGAVEVVRQRVLLLRGTDRADLEQAERDCLKTRAAMPDPPALDVVTELFGLSEFERAVLVLCAGVELVSTLADDCADAHGDRSRRYATFGLALAAFHDDAHWTALSPAGALRNWHLVEVSHADAPTTSALRVDERVLHALAGVAYVDPRLRSVLSPMPTVRLPPGLFKAAVERVVALWALGDLRPRPLLHGRQHSDLSAVAAASAAAVGRRAMVLSAQDLAGIRPDRDLVARLAEREAALSSLVLVVDAYEGTPEEVREALDFCGRTNAPAIVIAREPLRGPMVSPTAVHVPGPSPAERRAIWRELLGLQAELLGSSLDRVVSQFELSLRDCRVVASALLGNFEAAEALGAESVELVNGDALWSACRAQARSSLDLLALRVEARATWADLVLPEQQLSTLRQVAMHVRQRLRVLDEWGFGARTSRGLGTAALFAGPSGTGKTLAAEVLAAELELDLYRIDLSQVVSKYIGETEKNLRRVFDAAENSGAVLLFDEADALFGKRSEVKDSHDRYANIEVSYLLQRMEVYRGLAILTTNLKSSLDPAFLRRLRFVVQFALPDAAQRAEIWRRAFPARTPIDGIDPDQLSVLSISGGSIFNIALMAAYLAADAGEPVRSDHILTATRTEYSKLERSLTDVEARGWRP